ncbi:MAG: hypothetical protein ACYCPF_18640 [Streptosporangiaceae bacterium]
MRRTRGLVSGLLLVLLGAWAGLAPFIAPYGGYGITPATPWHFDAGRLYFSVLPGAVVLVAGLIVAAGRLRPLAVGSALVAAIGGIWLGYGITLTRALFPFRVAAAMLAHGTAIGSTPARMLLSAGALYYAPGVLIVFVAALAIGRISVVAHKDHVRYAAAAAATTATGVLQPAGSSVDLLPGADRTAEPSDDAAGYPEDDYERYGAIYERFGDDQIILSAEDEPFPRIDPAEPEAGPSDEAPDAGGTDAGGTDTGTGGTDTGTGGTDTGTGGADTGQTAPLSVNRPTSGPLPPTDPSPGPGPDPGPGADSEPGAGRADSGSLAGQAATAG